MLVTTVGVLLEGLVSRTLEETVAVFVNVPVIVGTTAMVTVATEVSASEPRLQETTPPILVHVPWLADAEVNVRLAGSASVTVTLVAVDGPLFVTDIVYVREVPTLPGLGDAVLAVARSARGVTQQAISETLIVSTYQPVLLVELSVPQTQRNWTF